MLGTTSFITRFVIFLGLLALSGNCFASAESQDKESAEAFEKDNQFIAKQWDNGPYFSAALGYSTLLQIENDTSNGSGLGGNVQVALGYWAFDALGLELGATISYNYNDAVTYYQYSEREEGNIVKTRFDDIETHIWDTSFYYGVMFRWPFLKSGNSLNVYSKLFNGYGKTVYWLKESPKEGVDRFFSDGPYWGLSIGNIFNAYNDKNLWFVQITGAIKFVRKFVAIRDGGVLPEEVDELKNTNNFRLLQLHLSLGCRFF